MDLSQLYDPTLDEYVPEALDFLAKFSFDSLSTDLSTPKVWPRPETSSRWVAAYFPSRQWTT